MLVNNSEVSISKVKSIDKMVKKAITVLVLVYRNSYHTAYQT